MWATQQFGPFTQLQPAILCDTIILLCPLSLFPRWVAHSNPLSLRFPQLIAASNQLNRALMLPCSLSQSRRWVASSNPLILAGIVPIKTVAVSMVPILKLPSPTPWDHPILMTLCLGLAQLNSPSPNPTASVHQTVTTLSCLCRWLMAPSSVNLSCNLLLHVPLLIPSRGCHLIGLPLFLSLRCYGAPLPLMAPWYHMTFHLPQTLTRESLTS